MADKQSPQFNVSYYDARHVFLTGATGFVGTALVVKLILSTRCAKLTVLVRGGRCRFWKHIDESLPRSISEPLRQSGRVQVVEGDLKREKFGLSADSFAAILEASIIIHAASSINLEQSLARISQSVVYPSVQLAKIAAASSKLDRFVYISTAYSNAHLHLLHDLVETEVEERIYCLGSGDCEQELSELQAIGSTTVFETTNFPWPYSYAKHLSERLIQQAFEREGRADRFLIVRPSVIGPALAEPFPYYEVRGSVPATAVMAALVLSTSVRMTFSSPFDHPEIQSNIDEVPVDVVVNRIIVHTAAGSSGCVHAVAGPRGRRSFENLWSRANELRVIPWAPRVSWKPVDWASNELHPLSRFFKMLGTSYLFAQSKTDNLWDFCMADADKQEFPLYLKTPRDLEDLSLRGKAVQTLLRWMFSRWRIPPSLARVLVKDVKMPKRSGMDKTAVGCQEAQQAPMVIDDTLIKA